MVVLWKKTTQRPGIVCQKLHEWVQLLKMADMPAGPLLAALARGFRAADLHNGLLRGYKRRCSPGISTSDIIRAMRALVATQALQRHTAIENVGVFGFRGEPLRHACNSSEPRTKCRMYIVCFDSACSFTFYPRARLQSS